MNPGTPSSTFTKTPKQREAVDLLGGQARHVLLYGGSRSGKSVILLYAMVVRALKCKSRHLVLRFRFNHCKTSIWHDSLPKVIELACPGVAVRWDKADFFLSFPNGSEIWIGGLDEKDRTEKILGTEYCLAPTARVLTSDLRWVDASTLSPGQELIAFPEDIRGHITIVRSTVMRAEQIEATRYRVTTDFGETIVSAKHLFVGRSNAKRPSDPQHKWISAESLVPGDRIKFTITPWDVGISYEDGWLAGMYDGEGWVSHESGSFGLAQNEGPTLERVKNSLSERGINFREHRQNGGNGACQTLQTRGIWQTMKALGMIRPGRLLPKAPFAWEGRRAFARMGYAAHDAIVQSIECLGAGPVIALGTSTQTVIADGFLGHNSTIFFNECSQITYDAVTMALTRLAENAGLVNRAYYDCNPPSRRHWAYRLFMEHLDPITKAALPQDVYTSMLMNPTDNRANLPPGYIETTLETLPSRARDRFLLGKWLDVVEGALWLQEMIDQHRVTQAPAMERIVVAIDPAVTATKKSDETGIVVLGKCGDHGYALEDLSGRWSPQEWGKRALDAFYRWRADAIVAEVNQGGDLVEANLRTLDPNVPYHSINAMRGKIVRAEPIASLYEQGRVHHVGILPELEDQMTNWTGEANWSPDRLDAAVHGLTALLLTQPSGQTVTYDGWEEISPY